MVGTINSTTPCYRTWLHGINWPRLLTSYCTLNRPLNAISCCFTSRSEPKTTFWTNVYLVPVEIYFRYNEFHTLHHHYPRKQNQLYRFCLTTYSFSSFSTDLLISINTSKISLISTISVEINYIISTARPRRISTERMPPDALLRNRK